MTTPLEQKLKVRVTARDRSRLAPHLAGWNHLQEMLLLEEFTLEEVKMLIFIEAEGACRPAIMDRLIARMKKMERAELVAAIMKRGKERRAGKAT